MAAALESPSSRSSSPPPMILSEIPQQEREVRNGIALRMSGISSAPETVIGLTRDIALLSRDDPYLYTLNTSFIHLMMSKRFAQMLPFVQEELLSAHVECLKKMSLLSQLQERDSATQTTADLINDLSIRFFFNERSALVLVRGKEAEEDETVLDASQAAAKQAIRRDMKGELDEAAFTRIRHQLQFLTKEDPLVRELSLFVVKILMKGASFLEGWEILLDLQTDCMAKMSLCSRIRQPTNELRAVIRRIERDVYARLTCLRAQHALRRLEIERQSVQASLQRATQLLQNED